MSCKPHVCSLTAIRIHSTFILVIHTPSTGGKKGERDKNIFSNHHHNYHWAHFAQCLEDLIAIWSNIHKQERGRKTNITNRQLDNMKTKNLFAHISFQSQRNLVLVWWALTTTATEPSTQIFLFHQYSLPADIDNANN